VALFVVNWQRSEVEDLVGLFMKPLILRMRLHDSMTFADLVAAGRARTLAVFAHQDLPFEQLLERLELPRDLSRTPLFQVMLTLLEPQTPQRLPGLELSSFEFDSGTSQQDLTLTLTLTENSIQANLEYASALFDEWRM